MYRKVIDEAEELLKSVFWKRLVQEINNERADLFKRLSKERIKTMENAHKVSYLQGQLSVIDKFVKMPDKVIEQLRKDSGVAQRSPVK